MQRTKLQALVRASLTQKPTISNEGFLGDIISKIGEVLSNRKKVLTESESKKLLDDNKALISRLKDTVLNDKWMSKAEMKTADISEAWAVPGLDYNSQLTDTSVLPHLEKCIPKFLNDLQEFRVLQQKYSDATNALYDHFLTDVVAAVKASKDVDAVISTYDKKAKTIVDPITAYASKPLLVFGNHKLTYNKKHHMLDTASLGPTKVKHIKPLTKEEVIKVANQLVELIASPLASDDGLKYAIDWEDVRYELNKAGVAKDVVEDVVEKFNDSVFMSRFYHQYAWDNSGTYDGIWEHQSLIKMLFRLINASIK